MDLLEQTIRLCKMYDIKPARSRGQNFLIREEVYDRAVEQAELKPSETVLEVGPGLGFLTAKLAAKAGRVVAVELDDKLAGVLKTGLLAKNIRNVEVINEDVLKFSIFNFSAQGRPALGGQFSNNFQLSNFKIVANLPYNITSIFLRKYLEAMKKPELMVLMLQKEVAERITAKPGEMSLLAVSVQFYAQAEIIEIVPKKYFWPEPEVDSAIVKIKPRVRPPLNLPLSKGENIAGKGSEKDFFRLVKIGFSAKRKMLKNNLAAGYKIDQAEAEEKIIKAGLNGKIRAQELSLEDWLKLFVSFRQAMV